ncbi:hypothetical protein DDD64_03560 [Actinotignum sanguinis]|nr:hypothetical protein DDD64_03560 [Actinotignum sanguinis]
MRRVAARHFRHPSAGSRSQPEHQRVVAPPRQRCAVAPPPAPPHGPRAPHGPHPPSPHHPATRSAHGAEGSGAPARAITVAYRTAEPTLQREGAGPWVPSGSLKREWRTPSPGRFVFSSPS